MRVGSLRPARSVAPPLSVLRAAARVLTGLFLQLIDFMITTHPAYGQLKKLAEERQTNIHEGAAPCTVGPCF